MTDQNSPLPLVPDEEIRQIVQRVLNQTMGMKPAAETPAAAPAPAPAPAPQPAAGKVVAIGADHGGFELKEALKKDLIELGYEIIDVGTTSKEAVDYPDFAHEVARLVATGKAWRGMMIDGAGIGSCMVANKVPGVRAAMAYDYASASNSREHNDANVLTLGAGLIGVNLARQILKVWLSTEFGGGRHQKRIDKITAVEKQYGK
ncbi:MAG: ribose 5-phosphate isomerase B [Bellilinea sp.]